MYCLNLIKSELKQKKNIVYLFTMNLHFNSTKIKEIF